MLNSVKRINFISVSKFSCTFHQRGIQGDRKATRLMKGHVTESHSASLEPSDKIPQRPRVWKDLQIIIKKNGKLAYNFKIWAPKYKVGKVFYCYSGF